MTSPSALSRPPTTVLLVDDDADTRLLVRILLEGTRQFKVVAESANAVEGIARARDVRPDVVVLDIDMPGMSGIEALPLIRRASTRTRVILFSDRVLQLSPSQAKDIGADLLVPKGPDCKTLVPALLRVMHAAGQEQGSNGSGTLGLGKEPPRGDFNTLGNNWIVPIEQEKPPKSEATTMAALLPKVPITSILKEPPPPILARRVDLPGELLGFSAPPCAVHIKFFPLPKGWTLVALAAPGKPSAVARWLEAYAPTTINIAPGLSPKVLRANFDKLPEAWDKLLSSVIVHYLELTSDGSASVFIEDTPAKVEVFVSSVKVQGPKIRARQSLSGPQRVRLTARQLEILSLAVALGYYEVPHKLNLRDLAKKLGLSVGAVSELLRRGEALIVTSYVDSLAQAQWSDFADKERATEIGPADPLVPR